MTNLNKTDGDDATDSFLGYLYQLRFALLGGLRLHDPSESVAVELLDDVSFSNPSGVADQLHQLKHSVQKKASLGAKSKNLWKTIGNWSSKVSNGKIDLQSTTLFLHTTGKVTMQSPLSKLMLHDRDEATALAELRTAASTSTSDVISRNSSKFVNLKKREQKALLEQIIVIDSAADIGEAARSIERVLAISSRPDDLESHRQYLEGWFFDQAIESLLGNRPRLVALQEIRNQSITIRDQLVADRLPELPFTDVPNDQIPDDDTRTFVRQLRLIASRSGRVRRAQIEHFRALTQRSEWSREGKVAVQELPKFDSRLIGEWEIRHESACVNSEGKCESVELAEAERVFKWVEEHAPSSTQLFIRRSFTEPFLIRGSFHMLADRKRVGWHPRYIELLGDDQNSTNGETP